MITARGLTKHYGRVAAVRDLTFTVRPGVVTGFLGPNGAGKSTTMRILIGLDRPDAGEATVAAEGRTVLISSHLINEVAATADELIVIGQERLLAHTTVAELAATASSLEDAFFRLTESASDYTGETR
jgi:ABC-2 type transport system ATP-binding protein